MTASMASLVVCGLLLGGDKGKEYDAGSLCEPAYAIDDVIRGPVTRYVPQAGDIYMSSDCHFLINAGHRLALSAQPNHSGMVVMTRDGRPAIFEAGPFNNLKIEILDLNEDLCKHEERKEKVWIRQRKTPLTPEQCAQLTEWAEVQTSKRFAAFRMMRQMSPIRARGPLRTYVLGTPHGQRECYFCAELVMESCVHVGLLSPETTRPSATFPRDMFFDGQSVNLYLHRHFTLVDGWLPPARWLPGVPVEDVKSAKLKAMP